MRYLMAALLGLVLVWLGLAFLTDLSGRFRDTQHPSASELPVAGLSSLEGSGAIVYFREGTGHLNPYMVFLANGRVETKSLSLTHESMCQTKEGLRKCPASVSGLMQEMGAGPMYVGGVVRNETVVVKEIKPSSSEAAGLSIVSVGANEEVSLGEFVVRAESQDGILIQIFVTRDEEVRQARLRSGEIARLYPELYVSYAVPGRERGKYVLALIPLGDR